MPMLLGTKGADILKWRASAELVAVIEERLARKRERGSFEEARSFLEQYLATLGAELEYEGQLKRELEVLNAGIDEASSTAELVPIRERYLELVSAHFRRRRSVLALRSLCSELHDRTLARLASLAAARMLELGQGKSPRFALLTAGDRGRGEQTLTGRNRYFLLHQEEPARFLLFRRQFGALLGELGLSDEDRTPWHGGLKEWGRFLHGNLVPAEERSLEGPLPLFSLFTPQPREAEKVPAAEFDTVALADLVLVRGDASLAAGALAAAGELLAGERHREPFLQLARQVVGLPTALGRFGRWRLERAGEHKGELNLREYALGPLIAALRVLALHAGVQASGSVERIHRLLEVGALDVDLAERLLKAYQVMMQLRILIEIRGDDGDWYLNPEEFSAETEARFRNGLEALQGLQKIGYQRVVGLG